MKEMAARVFYEKETLKSKYDQFKCQSSGQYNWLIKNFINFFYGYQGDHFILKYFNLQTEEG